MSLQLTIDKFKTKQVLDDHYQSHSIPYHDNKWWGEYDKNFSAETVMQIIEAFEQYNNEYFVLIRESDYKYTYRNIKKISGLDIYLKHYRVFDAKYSKTAIYRRNILRRTIAKKAFALSYRLNELNIPTVQNVFYVANKGTYISRHAYYVSITIPHTIILTNYIDTSLGKGDHVIPECEKVLPESVFYESGKFVAELLNNGLYIYHKELTPNILLQPFEDGTFKLYLCDLDIINAVTSFTKKQKKHLYKKIRSYLASRVRRAGVDPSMMNFFDEGAYSCLH